MLRFTASCEVFFVFPELVNVQKKTNRGHADALTQVKLVKLGEASSLFYCWLLDVRICTKGLK